MRKLQIFLFVAFFAMTMNGCSGKYIRMPTMRIKSNIPWQKSYVVVNNSISYKNHDYRVLVDVNGETYYEKNGKTITPAWLMPGDNAQISESNWSSYGKQIFVGASVYEDGDPIGRVSIPCNISGHSSRTYQLVVNNRTVRQLKNN